MLADSALSTPKLEDAPDLGAEHDWDWNADLLTGDSYGWNVSDSEVDALADAFIEGYSSDFESATNDLISEETEPREWEKATATAIVIALAAILYLFRGGRAQFTIADEDYFRDRATTQLTFLRRFTEEILSGNLSEAQIKARGQYYLNDIRLQAQAAKRRAYQAEGWNWERSILNINPVQHCSDCVEEADKGWVPAGTLIPLGNRLCLFNEKCYWRFSRQETRPVDQVGLRTVLNMRLGWLD